MMVHFAIKIYKIGLRFSRACSLTKVTLTTCEAVEECFDEQVPVSLVFCGLLAHAYGEVIHGFCQLERVVMPATQISQQSKNVHIFLQLTCFLRVHTLNFVTNRRM